MLVDLWNMSDVYLMKFLKTLKDFNNVNRGLWDMQFVRCRKYFKGEAGIGDKWRKLLGIYKNAFIAKFCSKRKQEELRWNFMWLGQYDRILGNVSVHVLG